MVHERIVSIRHDHPSLAGHFPEEPIVPGVVLLNEVLETLRQSSQTPLLITGLPVVKFAAPLRPGEVMVIRVEEGAIAHATFSCHVDGRMIASGSVEFKPGASLRAERE